MRSAGVLLAGVGALLTLPMLLVTVIGAVAGTLTTTAAASATASGMPTAYAQTDIPADYLAWYAHWTRECPRLPWDVVAAIGKLESDHGRARLPGVASGHNGYGAAGPMQIGIGGQAGDTWATYGIDGDLPPDGTADVYHAPDAIRSAVGFLCAQGASDPDGLQDAILAYNPSSAYVDAVLRQAQRYAAPLATGAEAAGLLANPNVQLTPNARADLEAGIIDSRVVGILSALAERYPIAVSVLTTGHSRYVAGTKRESHHFHGRAADIYQIDGRQVSASNPAVREVVAWLDTLSGPLRPDEVGSPFGEFDPIPGWFSDPAHTRHLHVGYES